MNPVQWTDPRTVSMKSVYPAEQDFCYPCDGCLFLTEWAADNTVLSRTPLASSEGCTCALWKSVFATAAQRKSQQSPRHRLPWKTDCISRRMKFQKCQQQCGPQGWSKTSNSCRLKSDRENCYWSSLNKRRVYTQQNQWIINHFIGPAIISLEKCFDTLQQTAHLHFTLSLYVMWCEPPK